MKKLQKETENGLRALEGVQRHLEGILGNVEKSDLSFQRSIKKEAQVCRKILELLPTIVKFDRDVLNVIQGTETKEPRGPKPRGATKKKKV